MLLVAVALLLLLLLLLVVVLGLACAHLVASQGVSSLVAY